MKKKQKQQLVSAKKRIGGPAATNKRKYFILLFIIVLISFIAYFPVLQNGFVNFDDDKYIQNNPMLSSIDLKQIFSRFVEGNYHPLTMLAYSIEYQLFGLNAQGYHAVNLLLHILNLILVFYVVLYLSNKTEVALLASLLFGIHPLHVESVAWASELKDLLYTFFFLASYICYLRYVKEPKTKLYFYCLLLFLLSLLSKAMAVSLPLIFLLTDYFKGRRLNAKAWLEKIPFFALSLIFGVLAIIAQGPAVDISDSNVFPLPLRIVFASYGFLTYLLKLIVPVNLSAFYPYPIKSSGAIPAWYYIYPGLFFILVVLVSYSLRYSKKILFGVAFFAFTVFLVLQLLPVGDAIMADRYSYIPSIGIFYLAGEGFYRLWSKKNSSFNLRLPLAILSGILIIFFSVQTYTRCAVWKNSMTLWNDVINKYQTIPVAYNNRGMLLKAENKTQEALDDYNKAIELKPDYALVYNNRGILLEGEKRYKEALADYTKAIELRPNFAQAYNNRGGVWWVEKKYKEAIEDCSKAIELQPGYAEAYKNRGVILASENRYNEALSNYLKAIELSPNFAEAYNSRGILQMNNQKYLESINDYNKAIELLPGYADAYHNRAIAEYYLGKKNDACRSLQKAIDLGMQQATNLFNQICR